MLTNDKQEPIVSFEEDLALIDASINEMDELYEEIKDHFDSLKGTYARGSLNFIQGQTGNLISLKTAKFNLIKERVAIKKIQEDLRLKNENAKGDQASADQAIVTELLSKILKTSDVNKDNIIDIPQESEDSDDELLSRLDSLIDSGDITMSDNDMRIKFEKMGISLVVVKETDDSWDFIAVDRYDDIVEDYPIPDKSMYNLVFKEDTKGSSIAVDEDGNVYKVVGKDYVSE